VASTLGRMVKLAYVSARVIAFEKLIFETHTVKNVFVYFSCCESLEPGKLITISNRCCSEYGIHGGAAGGGTALQVGMSRVRFRMV
jgi:hypothetical protein